MARFFPVVTVVFPLLLIGCSQTESPTPIRLETPVQIQTPVGPASQVPYLATDSDGAVWMSWIEERESGGHRFSFARLTGEEWSAPVTIAEGDSFFVNWADFPTIRPMANDLVYASYPWRNGEGTYAYDVRVAISEDSGQTWNPPVIPHDDGTATEHGFVTMIEHDEGALIAWLDGRNFADSGSHDEHGHDDEGPGPDMTLRSVLLKPDGSTSTAAVIDERVCDCCQTDGVMTEHGAFLAYRDRSPKEVRDIQFATFDEEWSEPATLTDDGWNIAGCPVNGAAVDASGSYVGVAWYTEAGEQPRVYARRSQDGGETFGEPVRIDNGAPLGRTDIVVLDDGTALVLWLEQSGEGAEIYLRPVPARGAPGEERLIATTSGARASGFPNS